MTANAPSWGEIEDFCQIDGWEKTRETKHVFYEKPLPDGRVLQTHVSHARNKQPSPGRVSGILRYQLEVSRDEFWTALRTGQPVERPVPVEEAERPEHEAYVMRVLTSDLHMSAEEIEQLTAEEAKRLVEEHWSRPRE